MTTADDFLTYLSRKGRTPETIRTYRSILAGFHPDPLACTQDEAEAWWAAQDDKSVPHRRKSLACIRSLYSWAVRMDLTLIDPTRRLDPPTQGRRVPRPMSRADMHRALTGAPPDLRRAICLGGYAGLRVSEAADLDWADVDRESHRLYVRGKGDKDRPVGMSPLLLDSLLPDVGGNVVAGGGRTYSAGGLQRAVNRHLARVGVDGTFHKLRSRYATVALAETGNLLAVSRALGHVSPATTALYALTSDADLDLIAAAVSR